MAGTEPASRSSKSPEPGLTVPAWKGRTMARFVRLARSGVLVLVVLTVVALTASAAGACGSLVAANGAVNLVRTSTLAASIRSRSQAT